MRGVWRHEDAVVALVVAALAIPIAIALPLLWLGPHELKTKVTLTLAIIIGSGGLLLAVRTRVLRPLQTLANLTASRLAMKTERKLRVFSSDAYVSIDYQKKHGMVARKTKNLNAIRDAVAKIRAGEIDDLSQLNFPDLVSIEELEIDDIEPLRAELDSFVDAIRTKSTPEVPAEDGLAAVETATRIVEAMGSQKLE